MTQSMTVIPNIRNAPGTATKAVDAVDLLEHALPRVFGYILVRVGNDRALAEDLTQETMITLAQVLQSKRAAVEDHMAWLFGTARNKVIDHFRHQQRSVPIDPWPDHDIGRSEEHDFARVLDADELRRLLSPLPPMQQAVLILHYCDGLRVADLAAQFGRSEHAIESLLARGRAALREQGPMTGARS